MGERPGRRGLQRSGRKREDVGARERQQRKWKGEKERWEEGGRDEERGGEMRRRRDETGRRGREGSLELGGGLRQAWASLGLGNALHTAQAG